MGVVRGPWEKGTLLGRGMKAVAQVWLPEARHQDRPSWPCPPAGGGERVTQAGVCGRQVVKGRPCWQKEGTVRRVG